MSHFVNTLQDKIAVALNRKAYTRAQLVQELGVSRTVLSRALDPLIRDGFVKCVIPEHGAASGRPVQMLSLEQKVGYIVGISIGRRDAHGIVVNRAGVQIAFTKFDYLQYSGWEIPLKLLLQKLQKIVFSHSLNIENIVGTGVALPMSGFQAADACLVEAAISEFWPGMCLCANIVAMAALAQHETDAGDSWPKMYVRLSGGVGSCLVWESPLLNISQVTAGEFGHVALPFGEKSACYCGNNGCLETVVSLAALCAKAGVADIDEFAERVKTGDVRAVRVLRDAADALGFVCAQIAMATHPSSINLGGEVVVSVPQIVPLAAKAMQHHFSPAIQWNVPINTIVMDGKCCASGAVYAVKARVTTSQIKNGSVYAGIEL